MSKWQPIVELWRRARVWLGWQEPKLSPFVAATLDAAAKEFSAPKMTGFLATLTPEQHENALAYRGPESHGDESFKLPRNTSSESEESSGRYAFKRDILDRLDDAFEILRKIKRHDPKAYKQLASLGFPLHGPKTLYDLRELPASWRTGNLPLFGSSSFLYRDEDEEKKYEGPVIYPRVMYFTKWHRPPASVEKTNGAVFSLSVLYAGLDDDGEKQWIRNGVLADVFLSVEDGEVRLLKEWRTETITAQPKRSRKEGKRGLKRGGGHSWTRRFMDYPKWTQETVTRKGERLMPPTELFMWCASMNEAVNGDIQVRAYKGGLTALFAVDLLRIPKFFDEREDIIGDDGKAKRIFHIVRTHARQVGNKTSYVKSHFRGERRFKWNGYEITISVPGKHHRNISEGTELGAFNLDKDEAMSKGMTELEPVLQKLGERIRNAV